MESEESPEAMGDGSKEIEGRKVKALRSPVSPTAEEIEEHEMVGHAVHRSWCGHCLSSRGLSEQHKKQVEEDKGIPTLSMDYLFFSEKGEEKGLPHLQVKDERSGMMWCSPVPAKGPDSFAVNFLVGCINEAGYHRMILKSDNEPSIKSLKEKAKESAKVDLILEEGKTGDKPSVGSAESSVRESKRQVGQ